MGRNEVLAGMSTFASYPQDTSMSYGGGFVPNSQDMAMDGATGAGGEKKGKSAADKQTLIPVTVSSFKRGSTGDDESIQIDGRDISQVTIVGKIEKIQDQSTYVNYTVDDGTGAIDVRQWLDSDESEYLRSERAKLQSGRYARVVGYPRKFNNERSLVAMHIAPVTDFNEITFHGLEVIAVHLEASKSNPGASTNASQGTYASVKQEGGMSAASNSLPAAPQADGGLDRVTHAVLSTIKECQDESGMHIDSVASMLTPQGISTAQIRSALENLSNDLGVYDH